MVFYNFLISKNVLLCAPSSWRGNTKKVSNNSDIHVGSLSLLDMYSEFISTGREYLDIRSLYFIGEDLLNAFTNYTK